MQMFMSTKTLDTSRQVVTLPEAAFMLSLSALTIRRAIKDGKIKAMQISPKGRYRILIQEIHNFVEKNSVPHN